MDPHKYDYLEAEDPGQPRGYLEEAAKAMRQGRWEAAAWKLERTGVSTSEWIRKLVNRIDELEGDVDRLKTQIHILMEKQN